MKQLILALAICLLPAIANESFTGAMIFIWRKRHRQKKKYSCRMNVITLFYSITAYRVEQMVS